MMNDNICLGWPLACHAIIQGWYYNNGVKHNGIDLRAAKGTPVFAAEDGVVELLHDWNGIRTTGDTNSYGNMIKLKHGRCMETLYAHLCQIEVSLNQQVVKGQRIGLSGNTGNSFGDHLHFEVWKGGVRRNPLCFLDSDFSIASNKVYTYGPDECAALLVEKKPTQIRCISSGTPACEVFSKEDINGVVDSLKLDEVCKILSVGDTVIIGNVQGRWYKVERQGHAVYCLYLPDRCRLE